MKKIVYDKDLKIIMEKAIDILGNAVGETLGPNGNNVIINTDDNSPYITNDGVTIANAIESDDKIINTIIEIAKEAALKTNTNVGDGTTTTLVLLQSILKLGLKEIELGINPIVLKKDFELITKNIINKLEKLKKEPSKEDYISVASISANDQEIGLFLAEIFSKMKNKYAIRLQESVNDTTYYEIKKGYSIEIDNKFTFYFNKKSEIELNDCYILILNGYLNDLNEIDSIINESIERNKNIIILTEDYDDSIANQILLYQVQFNKNIYIFKLPDYASRQNEIANDISVICNANIKNINYEKIEWQDLGIAEKIIINKEELILLNNNKKIIDRINYLNDELIKTKSDYDKDFIKERLAKFKNGIATIYVGAQTKAELKEKLMRFEDAISALDIVKNGVILGSGIPFLKTSLEMEEKNIACKIMKESLQIPFQKIMINSGKDYEKIKKEIIDSNFSIIFNVKTNKFENIKETKIIDPIDVIIEALKNATSIASILLTTNYLVINENFEKTNYEI